MSSVRDLSDAVLRCREWHDWEEEFGSEKQVGRRRRSWGTARDSLCTSCGTLRLDVVDGHGDVDPRSRRYQYSSDYEEALYYTRQECRLERIRRAKVRRKINA